MARCVCCTTKEGTDRVPVLDRPLTLPERHRLTRCLCNDCAHGQHGLDFCRLCPTAAMVWFCARVDHLRQAHPELLEKLANDGGYAQPKVKRSYIIGQVRY